MIPVITPPHSPTPERVATAALENGASDEIYLCELTEIPLGLGRSFLVQEREIAVFRTREDQAYALDNVCPHRQGPLAEGMLAEGQVVCPMHGARFSLETGVCDNPTLCGAHSTLQTFALKVESGRVYLRNFDSAPS